MATAKHVDVPALKSELNLKLLFYEKIYGKGDGEENENQRLMGIIMRANKQTGKQVVVLIDEYYVTPNTLVTNSTVRNMARALDKEDLDLALQHLQTFLCTIPYCDHTNYEGHYQQMLFVIFTLLSAYMVDVEVRTPKGRVDMVLRTATHLYLFELKLNKSADAAMRQIDLKGYPRRFALCGLPIVKVGINFDAEKHTITDWKVEAEK